MANSHIYGDGSGNSGSNNSIYSNNNTTINCNHGGPNSPQNHAEVEQRGRIREPVEGTCTWVTGHPKYKDWLEKRTGLLWISADCQTDAIVCYFFFKDDSDEQRSATFALCAILHQIFVRRISLSGFTEEVDTLWDILVKAIAEGRAGDVICVVDALDECEEGTRAQLIRHITRLPASQTPDIPLKFLVTSRPYHEIAKELDSPETTIRLKGEEEINAITADVNRVIDEGIKNLENSEDDSPEEFTNIVSSAPRDLAELYTKILNKSRYPEKARRILNIVVAAVRPLTLQEMNAAFRMSRKHKSIKDLDNLSPGFDKTVKSWCGLFVRVIDSKIYLVHQTAREFLIKGSSLGRGNWQYTLFSKDCNFVSADICISYLSLEDFEKTRDTLIMQKYALLDYAASHWADHFRDSQARQMELFKFTRPICETSWLGQGAVVERLLEERGDVIARSRQYGTALDIAAQRKDEYMARMLLGRGVNANIGGKEYNIIQVKIPPSME
ncbi:hypothetical protein C7212DRAFT_351954 [Tuber magnatum]|uniref:Uncharacterized protein n=1 Tax=Tuber magnatum TaxID=42249 RepID=A0A317SQQ1_9PEZI|nr:hypothetical protein C7212DRAFT_351954 [Tuber magnatum]